MKKFILASLCGLFMSTALYAQQTATPRYLMLIREVEEANIGRQPRPSLTVIQPDGTFLTDEFPEVAYSTPKSALRASLAKGTSTDSTSTGIRRVRYGRNLIFQAEVRKINELSAQGWELVNTTVSMNGTSVQYVFRKPALRQ